MRDSLIRCRFISSNGTRVTGSVDLPKGRDSVRLSSGSAKRPGRKNHGDSPKYANYGPFYRYILYSCPLKLRLQKSSVGVLVGRWHLFITLGERKGNDSLIC
jgi:hypothetical protein